MLYNIDVLQAKLKRGVRLGEYFPEYHDDWRVDATQAIIFFEGMFRQAAKRSGVGVGGGGGEVGWLVDVLRMRSNETGVLGRVTDSRRWDDPSVRAREVVFVLKNSGVL